MEERDTSFEEHLLYLFQQYENQLLSDQEEAELRAWAQSSVHNQQLLTDIGNSAYREQVLQKQQTYDVEAALQRVKKQLKPVIQHHYFYKYAAIAACFILVGSIGFYFYGSRLAKSARQQEIAKNDIKPGSNKAILTLANGKTINLSDSNDGKLAEQTGIIITKTKSGQLIYVFQDTNAAAPDHQLISAFNTLTTPRGGQYQITLSDGTKIWLNAASSLKFPPTFANLKDRKVELDGEAYFEVAHRKDQPFMVKTRKQQVEVLGTHFNINAYTDETTTKTTLLEGSVKVSLPAHLSPAKGNSPLPNTVMLKPGEQSVLSGDNINIAAVNTEEATAWKNGYFMFNNEDLESIMKKVSRWYNVKVEFEDKSLGQKVFSGTISRFGKVSQVIDKLELTGSVHFELKEGRIAVMK